MYNYIKNDIFRIERGKAKEIIESSLTFKGVPLTFEDIPNILEISFGKRYISTIFTRNGVEFIAKLLKKETVKLYLPIILEAFEEVEEDYKIALKMAESPYNTSVYNKIHIIRGQQVMLDFDLAPLYGYMVNTFNRQVNRNKKRFIEGYMFQLTEQEFINLQCQIGTANRSAMARTLPYAFSEKGILALSSVLKSDKAIEQGHYIIEQFMLMRQVIKNNTYLIQHEETNITPILLEHESKINSLKQDLENTKNEMKNSILDIQEEVDKNKIHGNFLETVLDLFEGKETKKEITLYRNQLFDADVAYKDIFSQANESIYIVDNYISIKALSHLRCKE